MLPPLEPDFFGLLGSSRALRSEALDSLYKYAIFRFALDMGASTAPSAISKSLIQRVQNVEFVINMSEWKNLGTLRAYNDLHSDFYQGSANGHPHDVGKFMYGDALYERQGKAWNARARAPPNSSKRILQQFSGSKKLRNSCVINFWGLRNDVGYKTEDSLGVGEVWCDAILEPLKRLYGFKTVRLEFEDIIFADGSKETLRKFQDLRSGLSATQMR